jgi:hypothetical protein
MKRHAFTLAAALLLVPGWIGCKKSGGVASTTGEPITGNSSDPAVAMQAVWNPSNRYVFRLDVTSSSQMPRRNAPQPITQDTTAGEDFSLVVTNIAGDGTRRMELEILSVQVESSIGDQINLNYDSESRVGSTDANAMIERLEKLKGIKFAFKVSAGNKITGSDGLRNLSDRLGGGNGRGGGQNFGGGAIANLIDPKIFRELIEMNALPRQPVRIGDTWTVKQDISGGTAGTLQVDLTYTFKGWQKHDERACARLEFSGALKPPAPERNNRRGGGGGGGGPVIEGGIITGTTWFDPEQALAIETVSDQSLTFKGTMGGRGGRRQGGTNAPPANPAPQTWTGVMKQHSDLKLSEMAPAE